MMVKHAAFATVGNYNCNLFIVQAVSETHFGKEPLFSKIQIIDFIFNAMLFLSWNYLERKYA
jgi:hypothetical protein